MSFKVKVDLHTARARRLVDAGAVAGLQYATEHLLTEANKRVPHDEGTLERSGRASVDDTQLTGAVSYDTPYAVRQHEDTSYRHDGKGEAKWLENTVTRERGTIGQLIAQQLRKRIGR